MDSYYNENIQKRSSLIHKLILIVSLISIVYFIFNKNTNNNDRAVIDTDAYEEISIMNDPTQKNIDYVDSITNKIDDHITIIIQPKATYKMTVKIKSINTSHMGESNITQKFVKYDLGVVWGKLAEKRYDKYIAFSQTGRRLDIQYTYDLGLDDKYIMTHLANNHIISPNKNISKGLSLLKANDVCYIEGKLVDFTIYKDGAFFFLWQTSLVRDDSGSIDPTTASCETIYLEKLIIGDKIYE